MRTLKITPPSAAVQLCRQALISAMRPYADTLGPDGMLAVAAAFVGQLIALQDQRVMTPAEALEIVARNIENANEEVLQALRNTTIGRA